MMKLLAALAVSAALVGCAPMIPRADPLKDSAAKSFSVPEGKAVIYVYRNEVMGAAVKMDVHVDGRLIGATGAQTFLRHEVAPGNHIVMSSSENNDTVEVNLVAGAIAYVWQEVKMGLLYARTKLHLVDEAEGKKGVLGTQLVGAGR